MKKSRFIESQITQALKKHEAGKNFLDICRELQINRNTFYNWTKKYSGMDSELFCRFKELECENAELKRMYADLNSQALRQKSPQKQSEKNNRLFISVNGSSDLKNSLHPQGKIGGLKLRPQIYRYRKM